MSFDPMPNDILNNNLNYFNNETTNSIPNLNFSTFWMPTKTARTENNNQNGNHLPRHLRFRIYTQDRTNRIG